MLGIFRPFESSENTFSPPSLWCRGSGYSDINANSLKRDKENSNEDFDGGDAFEKKLILRYGIEVQDIQI